MSFNVKKISITVLRSLAIFIFSLGIFLLMLFILIQVPKVQNYLTNTATSMLSKKVNSKVSVKQIRMGFLKDLIIEGFYIEDQKGDTLLYSEEVEININLLALLKKDILIEELNLNNTYLHASRAIDSSNFNYTFITDIFKDTLKSKSKWSFNINGAELNNGRIKYADFPSGFEFESQADHLKIKIGNTGIKEDYFKINKAEINNSKTVINLFETNQTSKSKIKKNNFYYLLEDISIRNSKIAYNNYAKNEVNKGIDYNRLNLFNVNGVIEKIQINSFFNIYINELALEDKSGFKIRELKGNLTSNTSFINIEFKKIITPQSNLHNQLTLAFPNTEINKSTIGEISANGSLKNEIISTKDLYFFFPDLDTIQFIKNKKIELSGTIKGKVKDFIAKNLLLIVDSENRIKGNFSIKGLAELQSTNFDITDLEVKTNNKSIQHFIRDKNLPVNIFELGNVSLSGRANGRVNNFSTKLNAHTSIGNLSGDLQIRTDKDFKFESMEGNITLSNFNAGKFLKENHEIGKVSLTSFISSNKKNNYYFNSKISLIEFKNYPYQNILLSGEIENDSVRANVLANDSNLQAELNIYSSWQERPASYKVKGVVRKADLYALKITENPLTVKTFINSDLKGNSIDSITGNFLLIAFELNNQKYNYEADSVVFTSEIHNNIHTISFSTPEILAFISGQYRLTDLPDAALHFVNHYYSRIQKPSILYHPKSLDFNIKAGNISPLLNMFIPDIKELTNLNLTGSFRQESHTLKVNGDIQNIIFKNNHVENLRMEIDADKEKLNFQTYANQLSITNKTNLHNPRLEGTLSNDHIAFNFKLFEQQAATRMNINGVVALERDTVQLNFTAAEIFIKEKKWNLNNNNLITYSKNYLVIKNFELQQGEQSIVANSNNISMGKPNLEVNLKKIHLSDITELIGKGEYKASGLINGHLALTDLFEGKGIDADLKVDSLAMNNRSLGDLSITIKKNTGNDLINFNANISGEGNDANANGNYLTGADSKLNMNIKIRNIPLQPFESFAKNILFKLDGNIAGDITVNGAVSSPQINGAVNLKDNTLIGLKVTNTVYKLGNQTIYFNGNTISMDHLIVNDQMNNNILVEGNIYHEGFKNYQLNLMLNTERFMVINSTYSPDIAFYGDLFVKANATINGNLENLSININTVTLEGSKIFIPLNTAVESQGLPGYIRFEELDSLDPGNKNINKKNLYSFTRITDSMPKVDFSKFNVTWNLKVTPEVIVNIIVDSKNGDVITGTGHGDFMLDFNSENHINVFGTYEIENGSYEFTFLSLIKKRFGIEEGSTIEWSGEIGAGILDATALYKTKASSYGLVQDQANFLSAGELNTARANLPVDVYVYLTGALTRPNLTFDIVIPEGEGGLNDNLTMQRINEIKNNPTELNRQVFSLIVFNRFLETGTQPSPTASSIALGQVNQSVSQILNSQLEKLSDNTLNGLEVNVSLESLAPEYGALGQRARIITSKQISERITVSAGGSLNLYGTYGSGQFAGDYYVYYRLNESGSVNIRFFRTSQQIIYTNNLYTRSGASINYRKDFNWWKKMFKKNKDHNK